MLDRRAEPTLSTTGDGTVTVERWDYTDTPDGSTKVDDTGQVPTVPAPPTLALLAAGAFGLRRWRASRGSLTAAARVGMRAGDASDDAQRGMRS
jgi:hypothetical protein